MKNKMYNGRIKYYFDSKSGLPVPYEIIGFNQYVFGKKGEKSNKRSTLEIDDLNENGDKVRSYSDEARRRALRNCRDLGMCNDDLNLFVTFTLNSASVNRYCYDEVIKYLNTWLDNRVRRNGLKYLIIPELHQDGAIHFHGLLNDVLPREFSGVRQNGRNVYNLPDWALGFTNCMRINGKDGTRKVAQYILKYMTKHGDIIGGRYYLHGGNLQTPFVQYCNIDIEKIGKCYTVADGVEVAVSRDKLTISRLLTEMMEKGEIF